MTKNKIWVSNTSPIIFLSKIDRLDILFQIAHILIPEAVFREVTEKQDKVRSVVIEAVERDLIEVKSIKSCIQDKIDLGEKEAISLALETNVNEIILDDLQAREVALGYSLTVIGTLGVLIFAKEAKIIPAIKPEIEKLLALDKPLRLSQAVINLALKKAGEI